ncbi:hypothetical protein RvY_07036 [Ramazzottius varieornatus]|uniref:Uncharacterized protein n=1 Tax=Ramazzottius varieornatus TaxID=947166 RepID=A0A1D1V3X5_RAMVA|nr:hypothetical protein RvY_07036 [Ramazzottius varieornatus]
MNASLLPASAQCMCQIPQRNVAALPRTSKRSDTRGDLDYGERGPRVDWPEQLQSTLSEGCIEKKEADHKTQETRQTWCQERNLTQDVARSLSRLQWNQPTAYRRSSSVRKVLNVTHASAKDQTLQLLLFAM